MRSPESTPTDPDDLIRYGRIVSVDLAAARCTVEFDDGAVSGPIRWMEGRAGETATWSPPHEGEEVVLLCPGGQLGSAVAMGGLPNSGNPAAGSTRTELIRFADGAVVSYDPVAHALAFALPAGATATLDGDLTVNGTITASVDVVGAGKSLKAHTHPANGAPPA